MKKLLKPIFKRPKACLAITLLGLAALSIGVFKISTNFGVKFWFKQDDAPLRVLEKFERDFGEDNGIVAIINSQKDLGDSEGLRLIERVQMELENTPGIQSVLSLPSYPVVSGLEDEIHFEELSQSIGRGKALSTTIDENPELRDWLISFDGKTAIVVAKMKPHFEKVPDYEALLSDAKKNIGSIPLEPGYRIELTGLAAIIDQFRQSAFDDLKFAMPLLALSMFLLMLYNYRSPYLAALPFLVFNLAILGAFGASGFLGYQFHNISPVISGILITLAFADVMHILNNYRHKVLNGKPSQLALEESAKENLIPTLLTTLTTALGLFSFALAQLLPLREIGIISGIGTLLLWVATYGALIPLLVVFPPKLVSPKRNLFDAFPTKAPRGSVIAIFVVLTLASGYFLKDLSINTNPENYFSESTGIYRAKALADKTLKGRPGAEVIVDSETASGLYAPEMIQKIKTFEADILALAGVQAVQSPIRALEKLNRALEPDSKGLPNSAEKMAQLFLLAELNSLENFRLSDSIDIQKRKMKLSLFWHARDSRKGLMLAEQIKAIGTKAGLNVQVTGKGLLYFQMTDYLYASFVSSLSLSLCMVFIVFLLVLKDLKLALLCLLPNTLPILFGLGTLGALEIPIDTTICMAAAVCLGLAVDDTIHLIFRYKTESLGGFKKAVPTLALTSASLVLGFSIFGFSNFVPNKGFGLLSAWIIFWAFLTDIYLLPLLLGPPKDNRTDKGLYKDPQDERKYAGADAPVAN